MYHKVTFKFDGKKNLLTGTDKVTVHTKISLLLQSDQGLHCLPFHLYILAVLQHCKTTLFHFIGQ